MERQWREGQLQKQVPFGNDKEKRQGQGKSRSECGDPSLRSG